MGEVKKRWSVTYTKHVKQKRKVYQDGTLHLLSNNKVMLYDESEQLLDSRFLTKDENVKSRESLPFASFLVDIGDPETSPNIISCANLKSEYDDISKEKTELSHGDKLTTLHTRKPNMARRKTSAINISPSQKIIREFRKNQLFKYEVHQTQSPPTAVNPSFTEWEALYTTQITQKAKKYHDGFIRMITCGSQGRQVMLYDSSKNQLDKRFLKKDEVVSSGESLTFDAYLVDIGDRMTIEEHNKEVKIYGANCEMTEKMDTITGQQRHKSFADNLVTNVQRIKVTAQQDQFWADEFATREKPQHSVWSSKHVNSSSCSLGMEKIKLAKRLPSHMHLRDAHQIISILRKPTATDRTLIVEAAPVKRNTSQPSELFQLDDNHHDFQGSLPYDQPESGMLVEEAKDEKTENEGCTRKFFECNDIKFETGHHVLAAHTGCHNNNQERPVCTQGTQVVKSTKLVGSSLIDRLQSSAHGIQVILDSAQDFEGSLSPVKNEGGTHRDQPKKRSTDKSETAAGSTLDMYNPRCSADNHGYTEMNVKLEKSNGNFDGPSFDLGI